MTQFWNKEKPERNKMNNKHVDVVVPNYNKVEFIEECLQSLVAQSHENWRCVVIDGYSDDGSWEVIQEYANRDDRFDLYQLDRIGLYKSWNFGLEKVKSPYFAVLTSDDVWASNWLEEAVSSLVEHDQAIAAAGRTRYIDTDGQPGTLARRNAAGESIFLGDDTNAPVVWNGLASSVASYFMGTIFNGIHSFVARSSLLNNLLFPTDVGSAGDLEWCMQIGLHGDIVYCPHVPVYWRRYDEQASSQEMDHRRQLGENVTKMVRRTKPKIQRRLDGRRRQRFREASKRYTDTLLPYFFERPPLDAFQKTSLKAVIRALQVAFSYPGLFAGDFRNFLQGEERYLIERRVELARYVLGLDDK